MIELKKTAAKKINILLFINAVFIAQQAILYYQQDCNGIFYALITFLLIERFMAVIIVAINLDKQKSPYQFLLLSLLYMEWRGVGFITKDGSLIYDEKLFMFLNSLPTFLMFFHLSHHQSDEQIPLIFIISALYSSFLAALLIVSRQIDRNTETTTVNCLYFLSQFGGIISYWGLMGQIYSIYGALFLIIFALVSIGRVIQLYYKSQPWQWSYYFWRQIFLIKQVDNFAYFKLSQEKYKRQQQSNLQSLVHFTMLIYKIFKFPYFNTLDFLLYAGSFFKCIESVCILYNIFYIAQFGPYRYHLTLKLNEVNLEEVRKRIEYKKLIRYLDLTIQVDGITKEFISDEQLKGIILIINRKQLVYSINLIKDNSTMHCCINSHYQQMLLMYGISKQNDFEFVFRFAQQFQTNDKVTLNLITFSMQQYVMLDNEFANCALQYLTQPMYIMIKRNYFQLEFIHKYNNQLVTFVLKTIALQKNILEYFNLNPQQIIYDLYEDI